MEDKIQVSVIMTTFGHDKYIKDAIQGVLMQEVDFPVELIIADNCICDFTETSHGATILGACTIGNRTHVKANATIQPKLILGDEFIVGAGAVATKSIEDYKTVKRVSAR